MIGQSIGDEIDYGNFFAGMDDLINIPSDDIGVELGIGDADMFPSLWSAQPETWPASDPLFSSKSHSQASTELYVPFENIVQMEQPSGFADDSSTKKTDSPSRSSFQSTSPVSVLESSSSSSQIIAAGKHGRPRTKRPRPVAPQANIEKDGLSNVSAAESRLVIRIPKHLVSENNEKKKKAKISSSSSSSSSSSYSSGLDQERNVSSSSEQPIRKCMHCEVTKTPQWRLGPMGPKTLCNACGVRFKSGRLFPEYRPAASPTFTPALHSNSHKKVIEMRGQKCDSGSTLGNFETADDSDFEGLIPNHNTHTYIEHV